MALTVAADVGALANADEIQATITEYVYDKAHIADSVRYVSLVGKSAPAARFVRNVKSGTPFTAVATESTATVPTAMTFTSTSVTLSRYALARSISATAEEDNILGESIYNQRFIDDGIQLFGELMDTTVAALFSTALTGVGTTGVPLTLAVAASAVMLNRTKKVRGKQRLTLHDKALAHLQASQMATTGTNLAQFMSPNYDGIYGGTLCGADVYGSGLCPTANAAADVLGAVYAVGAHIEGGSDAYSALAFVVKRLPTSQRDSVPLEDYRFWVSYFRFGAGATATNFITKVTSQNA